MRPPTALDDRRLPPGAPIRLASHAPLSGPMALFGDILLAARARFDEANAAGGVHGHPIELLVGDDRYEPARTPAVVDHLLAVDGLLAFVMAVGTPPHLTVVDRLIDLGVPDLAVVTGAAALADPPRPAMFVANPPYTTNGRVLGAAVHGARGGVLTYDTDFGRDWVRGFAEGLGRPPRVHHLAEGEPLGPAVDAMAEAGVDALLLAVRPDHEIAAIHHGRARAYHPRWLVAFLDTVIDGLGPAADGVLGAHWLHLAEGADTPPLVAHRRLLAERAPGVQVSGSTVGGHALADLTLELLRRAGPGPSRACLAHAITTLDGTWASPLMRIAPRKDPRRPVIFDDLALLQVTRGAWRPLADQGAA